MPELPSLAGLNRGQRAGIKMLVESLATARMSEAAKQRLIADRLRVYRERNRERSASHRAQVASR